MRIVIILLLLLLLYRIDHSRYFNVANEVRQYATISDNINNSTSGLERQIRSLKLHKKPLLIKVTSHPCAGKSTFINSYNKNYKGCEMIDIDTLRNKDCQSILKNKKRAIILGTLRHVCLTDVIEIHVVPKENNLINTIRNRIMSRKRYSKWAYPKYVITDPEQGRNAVLQKVKSNNLPMFHSFEDGIDFCIHTYDSN